MANILKCIYEGSQVPIDAALRIESRYFFNTVRSPQAKAMARTNFVSRQALAKREQREDLSAYLIELRQSVGAEMQAMVEEGVAANVVANLSRHNAVRTEVDTPSAAVIPLLDDVDFAVVAELKRRLLYVQAITAVRSLDKGGVADPLEADAGAIAAGFPMWTGGPVSYIEVEGPRHFVVQADTFASQYGERFAVPESLRERAVSGRGFYA